MRNNDRTVMELTINRHWSVRNILTMYIINTIGT